MHTGITLFSWAPFRKAKAAVKMHTLLDLRGNIPSFIRVSDGKPRDVNVPDLLLPEPAAVYVMDRAYLDYERLFTLHREGAFFVTRANRNCSTPPPPDCSPDKRTDYPAFVTGESRPGTRPP